MAAYRIRLDQDMTNLSPVLDYADAEGALREAAAYLVDLCFHASPSSASRRRVSEVLDERGDIIGTVRLEISFESAALLSRQN